MRTSERTIRYDAGNYEAPFLPIGEKVLTELNGKSVRVILTMETPEDFDRAEKIMATMRQIHALQLPQ